MDNTKKAVAQSQFVIDALRNTLNSGLQDIACCLGDVLLDSYQQRTLQVALCDLAEDLWRRSLRSPSIALAASR